MHNRALNPILVGIFFFTHSPRIMTLALQRKEIKSNVKFSFCRISFHFSCFMIIKLSSFDNLFFCTRNIFRLPPFPEYKINEFLGFELSERAARFEYNIVGREMNFCCFFDFKRLPSDKMKERERAKLMEGERIHFCRLQSFFCIKRFFSVFPFNALFHLFICALWEFVGLALLNLIEMFLQFCVRFKLFFHLARKPFFFFRASLELGVHWMTVFFWMRSYFFVFLSIENVFIEKRHNINIQSRARNRKEFTNNVKKSVSISNMVKTTFRVVCGYF